jgi:glycosyltransferase involved in cell wall biosynthesis
MKILVFPRDENPYQKLLYNEMYRLGVRVTYLGQGTPSHSLNILLLPLEIAVRRICGARLVHLHWARPFTFPGASRFRTVRRMAEFWFLFWLRTCQMLGMHIVWTVHNVLPLYPLFVDDVAARRALVLASDLVLVHSDLALASLADLGIIPRRSAVIPHGPFAPDRPAASLRIPGSEGGPCRFLFIGRVEEYKGVDDLINAFASMPRSVAAHLTVAGQCNDPRLRSRLVEFSKRPEASIIVGPDLLPEGRMTELLAAADVVVLPFRRITTSGSAMLALSHGRPLIVPDMPALADLPDTAVIRYDGSINGLSGAMTRIAMADRSILAKMSDSALGYAYRLSWREIASKTECEMTAILTTKPSCDAGGQGGPPRS